MSRKSDHIIILFFSLFLTFLWFRQGLIFAGGEDGILFYNLNKYSELIRHIWYESNTGYSTLFFLPRIPYFALLRLFDNLGVGQILLQSFTFGLLIFTGCISVYSLFVEMLTNVKIKLAYVQLVPLFGAVFYLFNPFSMTQVWGRGIYSQFFAFALVPLFLLSFILALRKNLPYLILGIIVSFLLSPTFTSPTQALVLWVPVVIYLAFYLLITRQLKLKLKGIFVFLSLLVFWVLVHSWWIIPNLLFGVKTYSLSLNNATANIEILKSVSRQYPPSAIIRLIHNGPFYEGKFYGEIYSKPFFLLISWLIPIVSLFSVSFLKKIPSLKFYFLLLIISLFVVLGANPPVGSLFILVFERIPFLQSFRNPFEKFGIVYLLAYTPFVALGVVSLINKFRDFKVGFLAFFLISGVFVWPMWTGQFAGGLKFNPWVKVPDYYREANDWLNSQGGDFRLLQVPLLPGDGLKYIWEHSYQGAEPSRFLFDRESVSIQTGYHKNFYNVLLQRFGGFIPNIYGPDPDLSESQFRSDKLYQELEKLNIGYIVLHKDIDTAIAAAISIMETESYLATQEQIIKVKTFGELDLYVVGNPNERNLIYSPQKDINYHKISPTEYVVNTQMGNPFEVHFLNNFDLGWEAYVNDEKISDHYEVFSYANGWKINYDKPVEIFIKYKPQDFVSLGWNLSKISLIFLGSVFLYSWRKKVIS